MKKKIKVKINHHDDENQLHYPHLHSGLISPPENLASKQVCYAGQRKRMQEGFCEQSSALKLKSKKGEIVEVHGGRILRSIGRKDRHSKICTVKGPRDRRVRLSANTAIEFYDVQDRLGYGRPSEAIDWLMKEAKAAIDALGELPATMPYQQPEQDLEEHSLIHNLHQPLNEEETINSLSFFAPSSPTGFQNLLNDTNSRTRSQSQGFCLSLQSFQDPMLLQSEPVLFSASTILNFEAKPTNWSNPQTLKIGSGNGEGREGFVFNSPQLQWRQTVLGQNQLLSQGGTLQSSYPSFIHASMNPALSNSYLNYDQMPPSSGTGNQFSGDGFPGFRIPPRIQGDEEKQNPIPNKPGSSATSFLHYQD